MANTKLSAASATGSIIPGVAVSAADLFYADQSGSSAAVTGAQLLSWAMSTTIVVAFGGTGRTTLTNHGLLVGASTAAITQLAAATAGMLLAGQGTTSDPAFTATPTLGVAGTTKGTITFAGNTSGTATIQPAAAAGTPTLTLPVSSGTFALLDVANQALSGGANVTSSNQGTLSSGTYTSVPGVCPLQYATNSGAFTLAAPAADGSCLLLMTNVTAAGAITFSGFSVGSNTGDSLTTTNGNKFTISIWRINSVSGYRVAAHQ